MRSTILHQLGRRALLLAAVLAIGAAPAHAQREPAGVVSWRDLRLAGGFTLAAAAVMPVDRELQIMMRRDWVQRSPAFQRGADVFNAWGSPGIVIAGAALYGAGWAAGREDIARLGLRAAESIALSGVVTGTIKGIAGRARPYASPGAPFRFGAFQGMHDGTRQSFPSGHTTAAFAFATALDRELRQSHPDQARWMGPALYGAATLTGLARMHSDNHWGSDVIMGAGIGLVSGLIVHRFHAERPSHWIDRRLLPHGR